jgi:hypothetical protein
MGVPIAGLPRRQAHVRFWWIANQLAPALIACLEVIPADHAPWQRDQPSVPAKPSRGYHQEKFRCRLSK